MNDVTVYDKQKWHLDQSSFPRELDATHAGIYGGFALTWFSFHALLSHDFLDDWEAELDALASRKVTPAQFFIVTGGVLSSDMLSDKGNAYAHYLFSSEDFDYYNLFEVTLARGLPSPYYVADNWENYNRLDVELSAIFAKQG